ncbi:cyclic nucleotide-binding protein [Dokdonia pacifica]|uniref:cAMP-binding domain of CRP or a regulatory subunit of cAMP-dependent protein kinases n=1 Tax=Dokdonia pacifica TaxID=1627892 RepID=A0A238YJ67_9FLAO|nr:Crp/Fnr family transcriptional regulator [Dokdonia pacifica]GGG12139.1 cyclic nucleotide-binding protein [Dokdonia pacifica]SNR70848.1 cAMP-binding domain of CRP or a regulatory subunit of cAMP-dependent protein kinases [Dokdonia pacifica]
MSIPTDALFDFITSKVHLTPEDKQSISDKLSLEIYNKDAIIVKQEQVCTSLRFVVSGVYRVYRIEDGKEITSYFNYESRNPFVASFVSLLKNEPSVEIIECIVPGQLLSIPYSEWTSLYTEIPTLNTFGRLMAEYNYVLAIERIESLQYKTATDRYVSFLTLYPTLLNKIPHHYIASYLGITPESLSRIRKQL